MDTILFYDSGKGGLSVLLTCLKAFPYANYVYFEDVKNMPYGNKNKRTLEKIVLDNLKKLIQKFNPQIVVLACNTATAVAVERLRGTFANVIFVGVEPAIKLASEKFNTVGVVATCATVKQTKFKKLLQACKQKCCVKVVASKNLAFEIEQYTKTLNFAPVKAELIKIEKQVAKCKTVVLGCTHYCLVKKQIAKILNKKTFDGNAGVVRQILRSVGKCESLCVEKRGNCCGSVLFVDEI